MTLFIVTSSGVLFLFLLSSQFGATVQKKEIMDADVVSQKWNEMATAFEVYATRVHAKVFTANTSKGHCSCWCPSCGRETVWIWTYWQRVGSLDCPQTRMLIHNSARFSMYIEDCLQKTDLDEDKKDRWRLAVVSHYAFAKRFFLLTAIKDGRVFNPSG